MVLQKKAPVGAVLGVCCVVLSLILRAAVLPRLVDQNDEWDYGCRGPGEGYVYRVLVRCEGASSATLYNALGQYCRTVTFSGGQGVLIARAGGYILCAGDAQVRFTLAGSAAVRVEGGSGSSDGHILQFDPPADTGRII